MIEQLKSLLRSGEEFLVIKLTKAEVEELLREIKQLEGKA